MKKILKIITLTFSFCIIAQAVFSQTVLDKLKRRAEQRAAERAEQKVNEKVDSGVDKIIDGLFGAVEKSTKPTESKESTSIPSKTAKSTEEMNEQEAMSMVSKMLGGMNKAVEPSASYDFNASYDIKIKSTSKKGEEMGMTYRYMFSNNGAYMGAKIIAVDDPETNSQMKNMEAIVFDFEKNSMYTFMNMNGQKQVIGIGFKDGVSGDLMEESYAKTSYTKTSQKKTIAGYSTTGYLMEQNNEKYLIWISDKSISFITKYYEAFNKMSKANTSNGINMAYEVDAQLKQLMENGQMMLGMDSQTADGKMEMEVIKISPNDPSNFSTAGYSNMMDMSNIMDQAKKGNN